jgi:D-sedoheptulose 7-phosphate isomerase
MKQLPRREQAVRAWIAEAADVVRSVDPAPVARAIDVLLGVRARGGVIYTAGNGGSAAAASHLALDLQKAARSPGLSGTRALSLSDNVGLITAWGNDTAFDRVFAEQLAILARPGDGLVVLSVSGSSPNLIALLETAREKEVVSVGLLGRDGGQARELVHVPVVVQSSDYGWVEAAHAVLAHVLTYAMRDSTPALHPPLEKPATR